MVKQLDNFKMDILKITGLSDLFKKKSLIKKLIACGHYSLLQETEKTLTKQCININWIWIENNNCYKRYLEVVVEI